MISYEIPGGENLEIENVVFDYNGTIALDGKLIEGVREGIEKLSKSVNVYVLTADTYGTAKEETKGLKAELVIIPSENAGESKKDMVLKLGGDKTICLGNGNNDIPMFGEAAIAVCVIGGEGSSAHLLRKADLVVNNVLDAIRIMLSGKKTKAVFRR